MIKYTIKMNIKLNINCNCQLTALDENAYDDLPQTGVFIEGIYGIDNSIIVSKYNSQIIDGQIIQTPVTRESTWDLLNDDLYKYYKIVVSTDPKDDVYWDGSNLRLHGDVVENLMDLDEYIDDERVKGYTEYIFSTCNLKKCMLNLQEQFVRENVLSCNDSIKCSDQYIKNSELDFLFIGLYLIENLIECGKLDKAKNLLDKMSSCNSLCSQFNLTSNKCKCNG